MIRNKESSKQNNVEIRILLLSFCTLDNIMPLKKVNLLDIIATQP